MTLRKLIALLALAFGALAASPASADALCATLNLPAENIVILDVSGGPVCVQLP